MPRTYLLASACPVVLASCAGGTAPVDAVDPAGPDIEVERLVTAAPSPARPTVELVRTSCFWRGSAGAEARLLYFVNANANLADEPDGERIRGELRFPSEISVDTGKPILTTFVVEDDIAELRMGPTTIDLADRRAQPEGVLAWEHLVLRAPRLFTLPPEASPVLAVVDVPLVRTHSQEPPVEAGVRVAWRWDAQRPASYRHVTDGPITVFTDPATRDLLAIELVMRESFVNEACGGSGPAVCRIHYVGNTADGPETVVINFSVGEQRLVEDRRYVRGV